MDQRYCWYRISQELVYVVKSWLYEQERTARTHYKYSVCLNISTTHQLDLAHHLVFLHEHSFQFLAGSEAWCLMRLPCSTQLGNSRWGIYLFFTYFYKFFFLKGIHCRHGLWCERSKEEWKGTRKWWEGCMSVKAGGPFATWKTTTFTSAVHEPINDTRRPSHT